MINKKVNIESKLMCFFGGKGPAAPPPPPAPPSREDAARIAANTQRKTTGQQSTILSNAFSGFDSNSNTSRKTLLGS